MSPLIVFTSPSFVSTPSSLTLQIIPPTITFIATAVSTVLLALSSPLNRDRLFPNVLLTINIVLPTIASGLCIVASLNHVSRFPRLSLVLWSLRGFFLSVSSLYVLFIVSTPTSFVRRPFRFFLVFVMALLTCETIAGSISSVPALLAPVLSLTSRGLLLFLAVCIFYDIRPTASQSTIAMPSTKATEQQRENEASLTHTSSKYDNIMPQTPSRCLRLLNIISAAQTAAAMCAAFTIALVIISENASPSIVLQARNSSRTSQHHARRSGSSKTTDVAALIIAQSACSFIWAVAVAIGLYLLPSVQQTLQASLWHTSGSSSPNPVEKQSEFTVVRTPKPSHSRFMPSESASDFLSMPDPFASPRPPPALPNVGLELNSGGMRPCGIAPQYRFPAPKAKKGKGARKTRKKTRAKVLEHQASTKTLLPLRPPAAQTSEGESSLKDEALLAQLLLQSLTAGAETEVGPRSLASMASTNYSIFPFPHPTTQGQPGLGSRWSASTAPSMTASTPWCEKKSMASASTSECARGSREKSSETKKSIDTGISLSSLPST